MSNPSWKTNPRGWKLFMRRCTVFKRFVFFLIFIIPHLLFNLWDKWRVSRLASIRQIMQFAARVVPPVVFEYFRGAAGHQITARANVLDINRIKFNMQNGADEMSRDLDLSTTFVGERFERPWIFCPVGSLVLLRRLADMLVAKVAAKFKTPMIQSTLSGTPMDLVAAAAQGFAWLQLYLCGGKDSSIERIKRARELGFRVLVLTIDTREPGLRESHAEMRPTQALTSILGMLGVLPQMITRLRWLCSYFAGGGMIEFPNVIMSNGLPMPYDDIAAQLRGSCVTWESLEWIRQHWDGKIVIKGIQSVAEARRAIELRVDGISISNHGGRELDSVPSSITILERVMSELGGELRAAGIDVMMDGGIRDGWSLFKVLTYGAKVGGLGRLTAAGIGAGGEYGLIRVCEIVEAQLRNVMLLMGVNSIQEIYARGAELRESERFSGLEVQHTWIY